MSYQMSFKDQNCILHILLSKSSCAPECTCFFQLAKTGFLVGIQSLNIIQKLKFFKALKSYDNKPLPRRFLRTFPPNIAKLTILTASLRDCLEFLLQNGRGQFKYELQRFSSSLVHSKWQFLLLAYAQKQAGLFECYFWIAPFLLF